PPSTRQVQSASAEIETFCVAITRWNVWSSATSAISSPACLGSGVRRVHNKTLLLSGSPDATPSGKRSRRSRQEIFEGAENERAQAASTPKTDAIARKSRRLIFPML